MAGKDGVPFKCNDCNDRDKEDRNCLNRKDISPSVVDWTQFKDQGDEKAALYKKMGKPTKVWRLADLTFYECPPMWRTAETNILLDALYVFHEKDLPPKKGAWSDQPLWFAQAYRIFIEELKNRPKET